MHPLTALSTRISRWFACRMFSYLSVCSLLPANVLISQACWPFVHGSSISVCCRKRKRKKALPTTRPVPIVERAASQWHARQRGEVCMYGQQAAIVLSPRTASTLLVNHEDVGSSIAFVDTPMLRKPQKPSQLLRHALTNANGSDWARQRPLVERALNSRGAKEIGRRAATAVRELSVTAAADMMNGSRNADVREFAKLVAVRGITEAVGGDRGLEAPMMALFQATLDSTRGDAAVQPANLLREITQSLASSYAVHDVNMTLLQQLVGTEGLSIDEAIDNAHSALLAGSKTTMVLIACAMLYLAEAPRLQDKLATFEAGGTKRMLSAAAITQETLRVHPPVSSQPRVVVGRGDCSIQIPRSASESRCSLSSDGHDVEAQELLPPIACSGDLIFGVGEHIVVDLVAAAHACPSPPPGGESWHWDPTRTDKLQAAPWGYGPRRCPAGTLSLTIVNAALEALVDHGFRWRLADEVHDAVGAFGTGGWIRQLTQSPRYSILKAVPLTIVRNHPS